MKKYLTLDFIIMYMMVILCIINCIFFYNTGWLCCLLWVINCFFRQLTIINLKQKY